MDRPMTFAEWLAWPITSAITQLQEQIHMDKVQLEERLTGIEATLVKAQAEIVGAVEALKAEVAAAGQTTPGTDAVIARLEGVAAALDALNPDAPAPAPSPAPDVPVA